METLFNPDIHPDSTSLPYLRHPATSSDGKLIVFCYGGDIWIVPAGGGDARRLTAHESYNSSPIFSPDDKQIAFASQRTGGGNIYLLELNSAAIPRRITWHRRSAPPCAWSADGKWIYFYSYYDGLCYSAPYRINIDGGSPVRLGGEPMEHYYNLAVSPDGQTMAFNNNGDQWWRRGPNPAGHSDIWMVSATPNSRDYTRITSYEGRNLRPMWDNTGKNIYFVSDRSGVENIWRMPLGGDSRAEQITDFKDGRLIRPSISADKKWIVFERDFRIWRLSTSRGNAAAVDIRVQSDEKFNTTVRFTLSRSIDQFALSADNKKLAFVSDGEVFADMADKGDQSQKGGNAFKVTNSPFRKDQIAWLPDSKSIVYVSDQTGNNEVYHYDFQLRKEMRLTNSPREKALPRPSPDGKTIAYVSGKSDIHLYDLESKQNRSFIEKRVFVGPIVPTEFCWSPDSNWIAFFSRDENFFRNIFLQHVDETAPRQVTFLSNIMASQLLWSADGKFLIFNTGQYRTESQIARVDLVPVEPVFKEDDFEKLFESPDKSKKENGNASEKETADKKENGNGASAEESKGEDKKDDKSVPETRIEWRGLKRRLRMLTDHKLDAHALAIRPNSKTLVFSAFFNGRQTLWILSLDSASRIQRPKQIASLSSYYTDVWFTRNGKRFYYLEGGVIRYADMTENGSRKDTPTSLKIYAEIERNFHLRNLQSFNEAWRMIRDNFYDPQYHGCDWEKIYHRFRPMVAGIRTESDFCALLNLMVGELNASHLGAYQGYSSAPDSYLGVEFDPIRLESTGRFRISAVIPDSPLAIVNDPPEVGDYLMAIDGLQLDGRIHNITQLLQHKAGRKLKVKISRRYGMKSAREITVQPIHFGQYVRLRYQDWVEKNHAYVQEKSDGRLGYVHIERMSFQAYLKFVADIDADIHTCEGVIIDVRFNGGGHIAPFILDVLQRRATIQREYRGLIRTSNVNMAGSRGLDKPVILITNEHSASNAEIFSEEFRQLGLGKVVGKPTAGEVIGTIEHLLLNGTSFRLPMTKASTLHGENTEGIPRPVDIEADRPLGESARNKDSQLDVAVKTLLAQIKA